MKFAAILADEYVLSFISLSAHIQLTEFYQLLLLSSSSVFQSAASSVRCVPSKLHHMQHSSEKLRRLKVDALYGKKKHFNAADRKEKIHYWIGVPLIIINVITGSVLFYVITDGVTNWIKFVPLVLAFIAALLSGFQTYLNLQQKVEGHRRIGNRYLAVMKKCDRLQGYLADNAINNESFVERQEQIALEIDDVNKEAEGFPTNEKDYQRAKKGIEAGEESYTDSELNL